MKFFSPQTNLTKTLTVCFLAVIIYWTLPSSHAIIRQAEPLPKSALNGLSDLIEIHCYSLILRSPLSKLKIDGKEIADSNCCDVLISHKKGSNIIKIKRALILDSIKIKISAKGYQPITIQIHKSLKFKRINLYFNGSKYCDTDSLKKLTGVVRNSSYEKKESQDVFFLLNNNSEDTMRTKTDGWYKSYEFTKIGKSDNYSFYTEMEPKEEVVVETIIIVPNPATLIKFFGIKDNIRLDVVLDDGTKDNNAEKITAD